MMPSVQAPVLEAINLGAPGLLGLDGLASKRLTIDFRKQTMEVSDSGERVAIDSDAIIVRARRRSGQLILVDSQANGEKIHVLLRSEEHPSELQYLIRTSYAFFCL